MMSEKTAGLYEQAFESLRKSSLIKSYQLEKKRMLEVIEGLHDPDMKVLMQHQLEPLLINFAITVPLMSEAHNPAMAARARVVELMMHDLENQRIRVGILIRIELMNERISKEQESYMSKNIDNILLKSFEFMDEKISSKEDIVSLLIQTDSGNIRYDSRKEAVDWMLKKYMEENK